MQKIITISLNLISFIIFSFIFIIFLTYFFLIKGIQIDNFHYQNINIGKLYIKIDKKVILEANKIKIITQNKHLNNKINYDNITKLIKNILQYLTYFQKISLTHIIIDNDKINSLTFYKNKLQIDTNKFQIQSSIKMKQKKIEFIVYNLYLKNLKLKLKNITGEFIANLFKLNTKFNLTYHQSQIALNITFYNHTINYNGTIYNFTNKTITHFIDLNKYNLTTKIKQINFNGNSDNIKFKIINTNLLYKQIPIFIDNLNGNLNIKTLTLKNELSLTKIDNNILIQKSNLNIQNNIIIFNFFTTTLLSKQLNKILKQIKIKIPIYQKNGKNMVEGEIKYNLKNKKFNTSINIYTLKSQLFLYKNNFLNIKKGEIKVIDSQIIFANAEVEFNKSILNINYLINNGILDLNKMEIKTYGKIQQLNIQNILNIKNYPENIEINLLNNNINLENFDTNITLTPYLSIQLNNISKFYNYLPYLKQYNIKGNSSIKIKDSINIETNITNIKQNFILKNKKPLTALNLYTLLNNNTIYINNNNFNFIINKKLNPIKIDGIFKHIDFNLTQFIENNQSNKNNNSTQYIIKVIGKNTSLNYKNFKIYSDKLSLLYSKNKMNLESIFNERNITIYSKENNYKIYGLKIQKKTLDKLENINFLKEPLLTFFAFKTKNSDAIQGFVEIKKGYIKELQAFNNIIAFINLLPSLVTFQPLGFSSKGYKIKNGYIEYIYYNNILYIKKANIKGENLTFSAQGYLDFNKQILKMNVDVNILVKLIKDIPIVSYILLGKSGGITLKLTLDGNLSNPTVHKNTALNIIKAPLGIIQRVLITPLRPFLH